jgi:glyoxylate/hydroxypyruvate reductase A
MALLLHTFFGKPDDWRRVLAAELPDLDIRIWPEAGNPADIDVAAVAHVPHGALKAFPNLRLVVSLLAGQEHLLSDPALPNVPIVRAGQPKGDVMINETALLHVLRHHRHLPAYALAQQRKEWISLKPSRTNERRVGVMGLGIIGLRVAQTLGQFGFQVAGWVRSPRQAEGIEVFAGRTQLPAFLARSEIVVNLLPQTPETVGILNAAAFAQMPKGGAIVNLGRGPHVVDEDLIAALDSDHLAGATLDVFRVEPLPRDSALWHHPKVTITPHVARRLDISEFAPAVCDAIRRLRTGQPLMYEVDRKRGY